MHQRFTPQQIDEARASATRTCTIVVHPECRCETVQAADLNGSTEFIAKTIADAPAGSTFAVGTEINLVSRLAKENPDKTVFCLDPVVCPCSTMYRVHPAYLAWTIESLAEGRVVNQIVVPDEIAREREARARPHAGDQVAGHASGRSVFFACQAAARKRLIMRRDEGDAASRLLRRGTSHGCRCIWLFPSPLQRLRFKRHAALVKPMRPSLPDDLRSTATPDLNCPDIRARRFRVLPPDPHGFDSDHDGIGCELD